MPDVLARMARSSERRGREARGRISESELLARIADLPPVSPLRLDASGFDVFAEVKRSSPSAGRIAPAGESGPNAVARRSLLYARAGAAAVSVLTEPELFGGTLADLERAAAALSEDRELAAQASDGEVASASGVPAMRKDFLVDPYQLLEARAAGAGGVLLVLRILDDARLGEMLAVAGDHDLFVLLEAFDGEELERAGEAARAAARQGTAALAGLNARDLSTLEIDRGRLPRLLDRFPPGVPRVAESGMETPEHVAEAAALGCDAALVGGALMTAQDPAAVLRAMIRAGRDARTASRSLRLDQRAAAPPRVPGADGATSGDA